MKIDLTQGYQAIIDDADFSLISGMKWRVLKRKTKSKLYLYAVTYKWNGKDQCIFMHRLISSAKKGEVCDHINGDTLDNRSSNIRKCTHAENMRNRRKSVNSTSSKFKGVYLDTRYKNKYRAEIKLNNKKYRLGSYDTEKEAAIAYDRAAIKLHGEYANLNFQEAL